MERQIFLEKYQSDDEYSLKSLSFRLLIYEIRRKNSNKTVIQTKTRKTKMRGQNRGHFHQFRGRGQDHQQLKHAKIKRLVKNKNQIGS